MHRLAVHLNQCGVPGSVSQRGLVFSVLSPHPARRLPWLLLLIVALQAGCEGGA